MQDLADQKERISLLPALPGDFMAVGLQHFLANMWPYNTKMVSKVILIGIFTK
jgi:hypothetical protein